MIIAIIHPTVETNSFQNAAVIARRALAPTKQSPLERYTPYRWDFPIYREIASLLSVARNDMIHLFIRRAAKTDARREIAQGTWGYIQVRSQHRRALRNPDVDLRVA